MSQESGSRAANPNDMRRIAICLVLALALVPGPATAQSASAGCSRDATAKLVRSFVRAYNRGDLGRLDRLVAQEPEFQWYFVDDEREAGAEDRKTLPLYFQERVMLNDHLNLRELSVHRDGQEFFFKAFRTTDDDRHLASGLFHGKGSVRESVTLPSPTQPVPQTTCSLTVWSMDNHKH